MDGLMDNWWDEETKTRFDDKVRCIVEQYSNMTNNLLNMTVWIPDINLDRGGGVGRVRRVEGGWTIS